MYSVCISGYWLIVGGPTPNKALFKELVAPPGKFSLMVPVCFQVIYDNVFTCCHCHNLARQSHQGFL